MQFCCGKPSLARGQASAQFRSIAMVHRLKISINYFEAVIAGVKPFEIRDNRDRDFQKGDSVILYEYDARAPCIEVEKGIDMYSGRSVTADITYVTNYEQKPGFVVFGISLTSAVVRGK